MKKLSRLVSCVAIASLPMLAQTPTGTSPQTPTPTQKQMPRNTQSTMPSTRQSTTAGQSGHMPAQNSQTSSANRVTSPDSSWAMKVAQGGMLEVKLGQYAADHAESQAVKDFGRTMVDDHSKANDELKQIAAKKGITLPSDLDAKHQATYDRLSKMNRAAFDKAYMADMVKDHKTDIAEFKREGTTGTDPELKDFANKTLPTLQHHLELAQSAQGKAGKSMK
jgi:putative membrane protein